MAEELRQLHLLGALGASRVEMCGGKEWLVVPTVALMEGVIHPVNARTPEFVSAAVIEKAAASWNGKPITIGHPVKNGTQCSADDDAIRETHHIGEVRHARYENKKMLCESWIDIARAEKMHPSMLAALRADKPQEVSVGAFVYTDEKPGAFGDKPFKSSWLATKGDHLAFLFGGRGACSREMGCGTHRAAMHLVTAEAIETDPIEMFALQILAAKYKDCPTCKGSGNGNGNPCEACDGVGEIRAAAGARHNTEDVGLIQAVHDHATALGATCDRTNYKLLGDHPCSCHVEVPVPTIRSEGGKWALYSMDGLRKLGEHATKDSAEEQYRAIQRSLARQLNAH